MIQGEAKLANEDCLGEKSETTRWCNGQKGVNSGPRYARKEGERSVNKSTNILINLLLVQLI